MHNLEGKAFIFILFLSAVFHFALVMSAREQHVFITLHESECFQSGAVSAGRDAHSWGDPLKHTVSLCSVAVN